MASILDQLFEEYVGSPGKPATKAPPVLDESEYIPERTVALFNRITCKHCGSIHDEFENLFEVQKHRRLLQSHWVQQPYLPTNSLPRVKSYRPVETAFCISCINIESYKEE